MQEMCGRAEAESSAMTNVISFYAFTHTIGRSQPALCYMVEINNLAQSVMVQGTAFKVLFHTTRGGCFQYSERMKRYEK